MCEFCGEGPDCAVCGRDDSAAPTPLWRVWLWAALLTAGAWCVADVLLTVLGGLFS